MTETPWYLDPDAPVPLRYRVLWSILPSVGLAVHVLAVILDTNPLWIDVVGWFISLGWFGASIYNWWGGGEFVRRMYTPNDSAAAWVVEPEERKKR